MTIKFTDEDIKKAASAYNVASPRPTVRGVRGDLVAFADALAEIANAQLTQWPVFMADELMQFTHNYTKAEKAASHINARLASCRVPAMELPGDEELLLAIREELETWNCIDPLAGGAFNHLTRCMLAAVTAAREKLKQAPGKVMSSCSEPVVSSTMVESTARAEVDLEKVRQRLQDGLNDGLDDPSSWNKGWAECAEMVLRLLGFTIIPAVPAQPLRVVRMEG